MDDAIDTPRTSRADHCGYILDRTPDGPECGKRGTYRIKFRTKDRTVTACAEHASAARKFPSIEAIWTLNIEDLL